MLKKQPTAVIFKVICAKKLGKGPFKSYIFSATYVQVNSKLNFFNIKLIVRLIRWRDLSASIFGTAQTTEL